MSIKTLVSTEELNKHLGDPDWIIFDCRFTLTDPEAGRTAYDQNHIPGARYAHLDDDLAAPVGANTGRHPLPDPQLLIDKLGKWGVDRSKQVVVYDDTFGAMAVRMWWLLKWLGHENVALLDGVLPKWIREKRPLTADLPDIVPTTFTAQINEAMWVSAEDLQLALERGEVVLLDARAEERYSGEVEPLDKVAGHVPGAINLPWEDNLDLGGNLLPAEELRELYQEKIGEKSASQVVNMCGSGVTACHNILAMEHAGLIGTRLYAGSWSEWITDSSRPVATGENP
ncbi:MAG: sulfurtransferase [Acidiferrobacterales bacterium]